MKLAFSTNAFTKFGVDEACLAIHGLGYRGVEIMADVPHAFPPQFGEEDRTRLQALLRQCGIAVSNLNGFMLYGIRDCQHPSFVENDAAERRQRVDHTRACLQLARDVGAPSVSIQPGGPLDGVQRSVALERFTEAIEELGPLAERLHVDLLIEPEPDLLIENPKQFLAFMEDLGGSYPRVGLNFDVGHFYCVGEDPARLVPELAEWTRHYHLEDIAATREHRHLLPGDGAIDLEATLDAIRDTGFDGFATVELYPYQDDPERAARVAKERLEGLL